jgi:hypothetical protein
MLVEHLRSYYANELVYYRRMSALMRDPNNQALMELNVKHGPRLWARTKKIAKLRANPVNTIRLSIYDWPSHAYSPMRIQR